MDEEVGPWYILFVALGAVIWFFLKVKDKRERAEEEKTKETEKRLRLKILKELNGLFSHLIQDNNNLIVKSVYFKNFLKKYSDSFDIIEICAKKVPENTFLEQLFDGHFAGEITTITPFVTFLSCLMYSKDLEGPAISNCVEFNSSYVDLIDKLRILLEEEGIKVSHGELRNRLMVKIFQKKLKNFKRKYRGNGDIVKCYCKLNRNTYSYDDVLMLYYLKYGPQSFRPFDEVVKEIEKYNDYLNTMEFKETLLDGKGGASISITDVDFMEGDVFENVLSHLFTKMGYKVEQTQKSNDQGVDLIVKNLKDRIAIQAKRFSRPVGNKAIQEVMGGLNYYNCNKAMVVTNSSFTGAAIKLAQANSVDLIDRSKLQEMLVKYPVAAAV